MSNSQPLQDWEDVLQVDRHFEQDQPDYDEEDEEEEEQEEQEQEEAPWDGFDEEEDGAPSTQQNNKRGSTAETSRNVRRTRVNMLGFGVGGPPKSV
jgi:hypothetical protein